MPRPRCDLCSCERLLCISALAGVRVPCPWRARSHFFGDGTSAPGTNNPRLCKFCRDFAYCNPLSVCVTELSRACRAQNSCAGPGVSTLAGSRRCYGRGLRCCGGGRATAPDRGTTPRARPGLKGGSKCAVRSGGTGADHLTIIFITLIAGRGWPPVAVCARAHGRRCGVASPPAPRPPPAPSRGVGRPVLDPAPPVPRPCGEDRPRGRRGSSYASVFLWSQMPGRGGACCFPCSDRTTPASPVARPGGRAGGARRGARPGPRGPGAHRPDRWPLNARCAPSSAFAILSDAVRARPRAERPARGTDQVQYTSHGGRAGSL